MNRKESGVPANFDSLEDELHDLWSWMYDQHVAPGTEAENSQQVSLDVNRQALLFQQNRILQDLVNAINSNKPKRDE